MAWNSTNLRSLVYAHNIHRINCPSLTRTRGHKMARTPDLTTFTRDLHQPQSHPLTTINPSWPQPALPLQPHLSYPHLPLQLPLGLPSTPPFSSNVVSPSRISSPNSVPLLASTASCAVSLMLDVEQIASCYGRSFLAGTIYR